MTRKYSIAGVWFCFLMMGWWIAVINAQSVDGLQIQLNAVRDTARDARADIRLLSAQVERNTADILSLSTNVTDLVASTNRLSGIGIAIGALGGLIFIFQSVTLVKQRRNGGA